MKYRSLIAHALILTILIPDVTTSVVSGLDLGDEDLLSTPIGGIGASLIDPANTQKSDLSLIEHTPIAPLLSEEREMVQVLKTAESEVLGDKLRFREDFILRGYVDNGHIEATIPAGATVDIAGESRAIKSQELSIESVDQAEKDKAFALDTTNTTSWGSKLQNILFNTVEAAEFKKRGNARFTFEFGKKGKHLIFSKPVEVKIKTPYPNGAVFEVRVRHTGEKSYGYSSLTLSSESVCDTKGNSSNPITQVSAKNGYITFYTCGASSFTINSGGGTSATTGLQMIVGDCAQMQVRYLNGNQIYGGNPPASGCGAPWVWPAVRIGTTTYGNGIGTAFTSFNSASTSGVQNGNNYSAITNIDMLHSGRYYNLRIEWNYESPNNYFTWNWKINIPTGNTEVVKFYYAMDTMVGGDDANDAGFYQSDTGIVGVWDSTDKVALGMKVLNGLSFTAYEVKGYATLNTDTSNGLDYDGTLAAAADNGLGVQWTLGSSPGEYSSTIEWLYMPYGSSTSRPDLQVRFEDPPSPGLVIGSTSTLTGTAYNSADRDLIGNARVIFTLPLNFTAPLTTTTSNGWTCGGYNTGSRTITCNRNFTAGSPLVGNSSSEVAVSVTPLVGAASSVTFNASISQTSGAPTETPSSNNSTQRIATVSSIALDTTAPTFNSVSISENQLIGGGKLNINYAYSDNIAVNPTSVFGSLYRWDSGSSSYILYTPSTVLTFTGTSLGGTTAQIQDIPYGKYRIDVRISDTSNNQTTHSRVFYVDSLNINISADTYNIGDAALSPPALEQIISVQTVGANFTLKIQGATLTNLNGDTISPVSGGNGWGYHTTSNGGASYTVSPAAANESIVYSSGGTLNTSGDLQTYQFKLKYSVTPDNDRPMGDYQGNLSVTIEASYP